MNKTVKIIWKILEIALIALTVLGFVKAVFVSLDIDESYAVAEAYRLVSGDKLLVGEDVANASVNATVVKNGRGKKVIVYKYKRKTGYHKKNGHRQAYTEVKIDSINA